MDSCTAANGEESKKNQSLQYQRYNLKAPDQDNDSDGGSYGDESHESEKDEEAAGDKGEKDAQEAVKEAVDALNAPARLIEEVDAIVGIKHLEFAKLAENEEEDASSDREIAIIGFWSLTDRGVFRCHQSFNVPNPMTREAIDVEGTVLNQVLFESKGGDIFFFFDRKSGDAKGLHLGVLDLEPEDDGLSLSARKRASVVTLDSQKVEKNCKTLQAIKKSSILER